MLIEFSVGLLCISILALAFRVRSIEKEIVSLQTEVKRLNIEIFILEDRSFAQHLDFIDLEERIKHVPGTFH